jgi:hypothetical protein
VIVWLEAHGCTVTRGELNIIELPAPDLAIIEHGASWYAFTVRFYDNDGDEANRCIIIDLEVDAYSTFVSFK